MEWLHVIWLALDGTSKLITKDPWLSCAMKYMFVDEWILMTYLSRLFFDYIGEWIHRELIIIFYFLFRLVFLFICFMTYVFLFRTPWDSVNRYDNYSSMCDWRVHADTFIVILSFDQIITSLTAFSLSVSLFSLKFLSALSYAYFDSYR